MAYDDIYGIDDASVGVPYGAIDESGAAGGTSGFVQDFFASARDRLANILEPVTPQQSAKAAPTIGSQLFEAVYQYGRGQFDQAREKAVGAFLMTSEGKKIQRAGVQQTAQQYWPLIALGFIGLLFLGMLIGRR